MGVCWAWLRRTLKLRWTRSIMKWLHPLQDRDASKDQKQLKDRMAKLCHRSAQQRVDIVCAFAAKHKQRIRDW